jgi:ribosomal protein S18 acetylase RimI-like enzyme
MKPPPLGDDVVLRPATAADLGAISRVMNHPPEPPSATLLGSRRASRVGDLLVSAGVSISLPHTTVAVLGGRVVGVMDCGSQYGVRASAASFIRLLPRMLFVLGPAVPRALYGMVLRQRLQFDPVAGAFAIAELYVDEVLRNRGIGGVLLRHGEELARRVGTPRMCLETGVTNPARRLYERNGYRVVATKTDTRYERMTGSPGRVLMTKELAASPVQDGEASTTAVSVPRTK